MSDSDTPATDTSAPSTLPTANPRCKICSMSQREHSTAEREGTTRHKFSETGDLVPVDPPEKSKKPSGVGPKTPSDPILRYVLVNKGIITVEELDEAEKMLGSLGVLVTGAKNDVD